MNVEVLIRAAAVAAAVGLAVLAAARARPRSALSPLPAAGLLAGPGVYLFTAAACDACDRAREVYRSALGADGFTELTWEEHPDLLTGLEVGAIPAAAVVDHSGRGVGFLTGVPRPARLRRTVRRLGVGGP